MEKIVIVLFVCISVILFNDAGVNSKDVVVIPMESIRFRIVANSDEASDQIIKYDLVNNILSIISNIEKNSKSILDSRDLIEKSIPEIESRLIDLNIYGTVNYGYNIFPEKIYKNVIYEEGNYESLVITIGKGLGENWWCVLFPPLCLLEADENNLTDIEYNFFVRDIIYKYL